MVLLVCIFWFHNVITLPSLLVSTDFVTCSYQCFLPSIAPVSFRILKCIWGHTLSCIFMSCSFASIGYAVRKWYYYYCCYYYGSVLKITVLPSCILTSQVPTVEILSLKNWCTRICMTSITGRTFTILSYFCVILQLNYGPARYDKFETISFWENQVWKMPVCVKITVFMDWQESG